MNQNELLQPIQPIIFYDGGCSLCRREISHYQHIDQQQRICWIDLTRKPEMLSGYAISYDAAMQQLHGVNPAGDVVKGVESFLLIWQHLHRYRMLVGLIHTLRLNKVLNLVYGVFARWRYKRRCEEGCVIKR